jgi:HD-GYP domain-containing protein (c-di-GMP phosphodiesterase class II)
VEKGEEHFTLYASSGLTFEAEHRKRLKEGGVRFVYVPSTQESKLRRRLEESIESAVDDVTMPLSGRCELVYESSLELVGELLRTGNLEEAAPRLRRLAKSIVSLHLKNPGAFKHFFEAAHHDAHPTTHAGNVATWLPALAMARGERNDEMLTNMSMGGLLYDVAMAQLPEEIRSKNGSLTDAEWSQVRHHTLLGAQMLGKLEDPVPSIMALQHHERMDGSGYPHGLKGDQIHPAARMIAIVDAYHALTSFRPYRQQSMSPRAALQMLSKDAGRFDPAALQDWKNLLQGVCPELAEENGSDDEGFGRRRFPRYVVNCPAKLQVLTLAEGTWMERRMLSAVVSNLSRGGLQLLSKTTVESGTYVRARLQGKDGVARVLEAMVVRFRDRGDGWKEIGAKFVDLAKEAADATAVSRETLAQ